MSTQSELNRLPIEIFLQLKSYLNEIDYLYFINCSKREFHEIKRQTITYSLTKNYSIHFLLNLSFRERILSKIKNSNQQLSLRFVDFPLDAPLIPLPPLKAIHFLSREKKDRKLYHRLSQLDLQFCPSLQALYHVAQSEEIPYFPYLPHLKELILTQWPELTNVNTLQHLRYLELHHCNKLRNIEPLKDVPYLAFVNCPVIEDFRMLSGKKQKALKISGCNINQVDNLSGIYRLYLENCNHIYDFSPLCNIPDLTMIHCAQLEDLSCLEGKHLRFELRKRVITWRRCSYLTGYHILRNFPYVVLDGCSINDLTVLKDAKFVKLIRCHQVIDVSPLRYVRKVELEDCGVEKIQNLHTLQNIHSFQVDSFLTLSQYQAIVCGDERGVPMDCGSSVVSTVKHLKIVNTGKLFESVRSENFLLTDLQSIHLSNLKKVLNVNGLGTIPTVSLESMPDLSDITGLGDSNRSVHIKDCAAITNVNSLKNVIQVKIINCPNILNERCLFNVPRLKIEK